MSEPDALVARITITPENLERWFSSKIPPLEKWGQDWQDWVDYLCARSNRASKNWRELNSGRWSYPECSGYVSGFIDSFLDRDFHPPSIWTQIWYDEQTKIWQFLGIEVAEDLNHMMTLLTPFRAVEAFSEGDKDDYVAFTNLFYSPESEYSSAAVQFVEGKSLMLKEEKLPTSFMQDIRDQFHKAKKDRIITAFQPNAWAD